MAIQYHTETQIIIGPAADRAGALEGAQIGQRYFEDDTGKTYRKSVAGAWIEALGAVYAADDPAEAASTTLTNTNDQATSVTIAAANATRNGLIVYNDSTVDLYVKMGATASTSSFTVLLGPGDYWEMPVGRKIYTGVIDGIWASDASGASRVTEW